MLIQLDDAVALKYQTAASHAHLPLATFLTRQLARFADTPVTQRSLVLTGDLLEQVDRTLGLGSTADPEALLAAIRSWAGITIGDIRIDFTQGQLDEIARRAEKQGKSPTAIVEDIVQQMAWNFFDEAVVAR